MSLQTKISSLATRIGQDVKLLWNAVNNKEPSFTKNTGFNKNFGTSSGTVTQGNDSRLSNNRYTIDNSVSYVKIHGSLKNSFVVSNSNIDWSLAGIFTKTLTAATTFTFSNLQLNKVITLVLTGNYTIAWPSYMDENHLISGEYDGSVKNYIQVHCTNATPGSEEVWWTIKTEGA